MHKCNYLKGIAKMTTRNRRISDLDAKIPSIFTVPASSLDVPNDKIFSTMKRRDFSKFKDSTTLESGTPEFKRMINNQSIIMKVSEDLLSISAKMFA